MKQTRLESRTAVYALCAGRYTGVKAEENPSAPLSAGYCLPKGMELILACAVDLKCDHHFQYPEVGIQYVEEKTDQQPPASFPAKLLAFLHARYKALGAGNSGMIIVPTELIVGNGDKLRSIVLQLAEYNKLGHSFIEWLKAENRFCNSLVDRIVPGKPEEAMLQQVKEQLEYEDGLLIMRGIPRSN